MLNRVSIIGAGNIGSRHLQALAKVNMPLSIYVVDPSNDSLSLAKKRYEEVSKSKKKHYVFYLKSIDKITENIDVAIIATNSHIRYSITKQLFDRVSVKYIVFEKILFDKKKQYSEIRKLLSEKKCQAWVNCSRRTMPFYRSLKRPLRGHPFQYLVSGSGWGLASNAIHLVDHMAFLNDCYDFKVDTSNLNLKFRESKHSGFLELTGTLQINFTDGSMGSFSCYQTGDAPQIMEINSPFYRAVTSETEGKSYLSDSRLNWVWKKEKTPMLFQSEMTNEVVTTLLKLGACDLTPYDLSVKLHLNLLDPLSKFVNMHSKKTYFDYPFT